MFISIENVKQLCYNHGYKALICHAKDGFHFTVFYAFLDHSIKYIYLDINSDFLCPHVHLIQLQECIYCVNKEHGMQDTESVECT